MNFLEKIKTKFRSLKKTSLIAKELTDFHDTFLDLAVSEYVNKHPNRFLKFANYGFSQSDEDGLTLEIVRRLELVAEDASFAEFGIGTGVENNTIVLGALGYAGCWFGNQDLEIAPPTKIDFMKCWITRDNIVDLYQSWTISRNIHNVDLISIDLDYNDYHLVGKLLEHNCRPKIWIVEYNAKFPPPVEFVVPYDPGAIWDGSDYFGASISSYEKLFASHGFSLIACNPSTGANAFFVDNSYRHLFNDAPSKVEDLYCRPNYSLRRAFGHRKNPATIELLLKKT